MHDLRLIHTDLKPENILFVSSEYLKIPDKVYSVIFLKNFYFVFVDLFYVDNTIFIFCNLLLLVARDERCMVFISNNLVFIFFS